MNIITETLLWTGTIVLLIGYIGKWQKHHLRVLGYLLLGLFWVAQSPHFFSMGDVVNAGLCLIALPLFSYFAYQEVLSHRWAEDPGLMRFLAASVSVSMLIYYGIQRVPVAAGMLTRIVADHTNFILNLMGYEFILGSIDYAANPLFYRINHEQIGVSIRGSGIRIIFACTAIQTLAPAGALITFTTAEVKRKVKSLLLVLPTIYVANLFRNVMVVYLTYEGITSFHTAHNTIAKAGSMIVLIILMLTVFEIMPEFYDNIIGIISLPKREKLSAGNNRKDL
ncbi:MAG: archaeosortase A [Thermoplasmata archaeon]